MRELNAKLINPDWFNIANNIIVMLSEGIKMKNSNLRGRAARRGSAPSISRLKKEEGAGRGKIAAAHPINKKEKNKLLLLLTIIAGGALFFWIAMLPMSAALAQLLGISESSKILIFGLPMLANILKGMLLLAILYASGMLMGRFGGLETYHGIIILRGEKGFGAMHALAKHPRIMRWLADFGLSLGFGMIYSFLIYRKDVKKFLTHLVIVTAIFLALLTGSNMTIFGDGLKAFILPAIGVLGGLLAFGVASLIIQAMNILTVPGSTAGAALIVPGVTIPFWEGLIAIIVAATVHEIAHGVLAMVEKLEVKNSGAILFGVLPIGAFVEPNEQKLARMEIQQKRRILIAGTTSNFLVFMVVGILANFLWAPFVLGFADGVKITGITKDAAAAGILMEGDLIKSIDGISVTNLEELRNHLKGKGEGDAISLSTAAGLKTFTLGKDGKMGVTLETHYAGDGVLIGIMLFFTGVLGFIILINLALAVINLVPIFLTDGYRLVFEEARELFPSREDSLAKRIAIVAGALSVLLLLVNFLPNFR